MGTIDTEEIRRNTKDNILVIIGFLLFSVGTFTIDSFIYSYTLERLYLVTTIVLFLLAYILSEIKLYIYKVDIGWCLFYCYFIFNMFYQDKFKLLYNIDFIAFGFLVLFIILAKVNYRYLYKTLRVMLILSIIHSFGVYFQYWFMNLYTKVILPFFTSSQSKEIMWLYSRGNYSGLTWQTAFTSGYLVFGLGIIAFSVRRINRKWQKIALMMIVLIMLIALLLMGKRAHILFMILSLVVTYLFSAEKKKFATQVIKVSFYIISSIFIFWIFILNIQLKDDNPLAKIIGRFTLTVEGLIEGEDITSGRSILYEYAFKLTKENPVLGIGWRSFSERSFGVLNSNSASHPHNIYIQLLTELGYIGILLFIIPVIYILVRTVKLLLNYDKLFKRNLNWKPLVQYSLYLQIFFILYGLTGNLLTDRMYLFMYAFSIVIYSSAIKALNHNK